MNFCDAHSQFLSLASETHARVQHDKQRAPKRLRPILCYIEKRLFAPDLSAARIYRDCDIRDRSISTSFRHSVGLSPWRYIEACRIEVGERMVRQTEIRMSWISIMLGYASLKVFSNAFERQTGNRPVAYRKKCRAPATEIVDRGPSKELTLIIELKRALAGRLDLADADRMLRHLLRIYPDLECPTPENGLNPAIRRYSV